MSSVDTSTKLSYLLPSGTFLTFQVLAPLATNNGNCGLTEKALTGTTLALLVGGCILTSFTDSYTAPDGKVYNGFLTRHGLWVPGYEAAEMVGGAEDDGQVVPNESTPSKRHMTPQKEAKVNKHYIVGANFVIKPSDYINALLSAVSFLTLTMFTDPVSTCFYPGMSETLLKTLPVLLAAVLGFFCSFSGKVRHGFGNSYPGKKDAAYTPVKSRSDSYGTMSRRSEPAHDETTIHIRDDEQSKVK